MPCCKDYGGACSQNSIPSPPAAYMAKFFFKNSCCLAFSPFPLSLLSLSLYIHNYGADWRTSLPRATEHPGWISWIPRAGSAVLFLAVVLQKLLWCTKIPLKTDDTWIPWGVNLMGFAWSPVEPMGSAETWTCPLEVTKVLQGRGKKAGWSLGKHIHPSAYIWASVSWSLIDSGSIPPFEQTLPDTRSSFQLLVTCHTYMQITDAFHSIALGRRKEGRKRGGRGNFNTLQ